MSIKVTILGASSAKPTPDRHQSCQTVNINEQLFLMDAGEGVQQQMFRMGENPLRLRAVFISHLHGDHCFGLFPLISTLGLYKRQVPLKIFAPAPIREILEGYKKYFDEGMPYELDITEVHTTKHEKVYENDTVEVWTIPLRHKIPTCGYLFVEKEAKLNVRKEKIAEYGLSIAEIVRVKQGEDIERDGKVIPNAELTYIPHPAYKYAYCSDTNRSAKVAKLTAGADLIYHEATYAEIEKKTAKQRGHSTTVDAAQTALQAGAKRLLIGHFSSRYKDLGPLLEEARKVFENTDIAREGDTIIIGK